MIAALGYNHREMLSAGFFDGILKGAEGPHLAEIPATVHDGSGICLVLERDRSSRDDSASFDILHILGNPNNSMRVIPHQVCLDEVFRN